MTLASTLQRNSSVPPCWWPLSSGAGAGWCFRCHRLHQVLSAPRLLHKPCPCTLLEIPSLRRVGEFKGQCVLISPLRKRNFGQQEPCSPHSKADLRLWNKLLCNLRSASYLINWSIVSQFVPCFLFLSFFLIWNTEKGVHTSSDNISETFKSVWFLEVV